MANHRVLEIKIKHLLLDVENPRHDVLIDQTETLREIILDQKGKLLKLSRDIAENGVNPSELTIVIPCKTDNDKFIVLEGNRRLAALKLLLDPMLGALGYDPKAVNMLKACSKTYKDNPVDSLSCVFFDKREYANHWIELRHTGENEGRGIVGWRAKEKARFNALLGKPSCPLQVVEFVRKNAALSQGDVDALKKPNLSSIQRLIEDPDVRETLGVEITDGYVTSNMPSEQIINGLTKLVMDLAKQRKSVDDIRHKSDRTHYMSEFAGADLPDPNLSPVATWKLQTQTTPVKPRLLSATASSPAATKRSVRLTTSRPTLIPSNCVLRIKHAPRINKIYRELRGLQVQGFENACAITFRVFLELSLEHYAESVAVVLYEKDSLAEEINKVTKYIESKGLMTKNELKPIRLASSTPDNLVSTNTLNAYVHNPNLAPKADDLKLTWNDFEKLFKTMWP